MTCAFCETAGPANCVIRDMDVKHYFMTLETPLGWMLLVGKDGALVEIELPKPTKAAAAAAAPAGAVESSDGFGDLAARLRLYFSGEAVDFSDVPVAFEGLGDFEKRVLDETRKVGHGRLASYKSLAAAAGSPGAARAVGNAMRKNPVPIVVPCHRVLHSGGGLGGYGGGLDMKRHLLDLEGAIL